MSRAERKPRRSRRGGRQPARVPTPAPALAITVATLLVACTPVTVPPAPTAEVPANTAPSASASFTLVATGDVLLHQDRSLVAGAADAGRRSGRGYDFNDVLAPVAPIIRDADIAVCHLETPVAAPGGPFRGYPAFSVQPQIVDALAAAGYDTCSTASNHSLDAGLDGVKRTLDALDANGIRHAGTYRSAADAEVPDLVDVHGVTVGQVAATFGTNGVPVPSGKAWAVRVFDPARPDVSPLLADAARVRRAGADVVVASVHCCVEYVSNETAAQRAVARALLASPDVDLVLGHHAHVVQPFEKINGKWVAYGLGNHLAQHVRPAHAGTEDSVIARFTFTRSIDGRVVVTRAEAVPTRIVLGPTSVQVVPTGEATTGPDAASRERVTEVVDRRGAARDGLEVVPR
jgi:poly-gamma-glutamate capsule biosynthesis protein CapA/YwtB (metallophosphatase superfamily)